MAKAGVNIENCKRIIPNIKKLVETSREKGIPVIYTMQEHYPEDATRKKHKIKPKRILASIGKPMPCLKGTWDSQIVDELKPDPADHIIRKNKFSAFYNTGLEVLLRVLGVDMIIVTGAATNVCVETTVRDANMRDLDVVVVEDCVAGYDEDLHKATLKNVDLLLGCVLPSKDIVSMIGSIETN